MLCWTHVRIHCPQFAGFCFIVKSVALQEVDHLPRLADALHVFSADFSLCSWRFVNLSHKLLQSLAATWTWQLDVSDGCAALVLVVSPTFTILLFFVFVQIQEREAKMPFTENLDTSNSLLAHFSPPPEYLYSQSEPAVVSWDWHADLYVKLLDSFCVLLKHHFLLLFITKYNCHSCASHESE